MSTKQKAAPQIRPEQQRNIYRLLRLAQLDGQKESLVHSFTMSRTTHTSDMLEGEADEMINYLNSYAGPDAKAVSADKMRKQIIAHAHRMLWELPDGSADMVRIDAFFLSEKSAVQKSLNSMNNRELVKAVSQVKQLYKSFLKSVV